MEEPRYQRYMSPFVDYGFYKLFGTETNKELLISLLNAIFEHLAQQVPDEPRQVVKDLKYLPAENLAAYGERRAVFDVCCEGENGEKFIVEIQKASQNFWGDRSEFYSSFPIIEQVKVGTDCDFYLNNVYTLGILNFKFSGGEYGKDCFHHEMKLMDVEDKHGNLSAVLSTSQTAFYDKLTCVYIEMPKFNKTEAELVSMYDKWLFVLKNLPCLMDRPVALHERVFSRLFEQAEIALFSPDWSRNYEESLKHYRDLRNVINSAERRGREEGLAEAVQQEKVEEARKMKELGLATGLIRQVTNLSAVEIERL